MKRLGSASRQLRDRVNYARRRRALLRTPDRFNTICSAMDVLDDTCQALRAYLVNDPPADDDKGTAYLIAYGVLHALYLQQDAAFWWCKFLGIPTFGTYGRPGPWANGVPELERARTARNDSTGHPVRRDATKGRLAAFFIVQHSLGSDGFTLMERPAAGDTTFRDVSFLELIEGQVVTLATVLEHATATLDAADRQHYGRFMNKSLTNILKRLDYPISKLGNSRSSDWLLVKPMVERIQEVLGELRLAIEERDEPFEAMWEWEYRKLHAALALLHDYASGVRACDDDLADVLSCYIRYAVDHMMELTSEIDGHYAAGSSDA